MDNNKITRLFKTGYLFELDVHFARFLANLSGSDSPHFGLAAALVSNVTVNGDVCLDLTSWAETVVSEQRDGEEPVICPELAVWQEALHTNDVVGKPGDLRPLILDEKNRLYLYRYWDYENKLSNAILRRLNEDIKEVDTALLKDSLKRLFPPNKEGDIDWQKIAAITAAFKNICVISGGPGTGKTTTVTKILSLLIEQSKGKNLNILLSAPTGKAVAKLSESIRTVKSTLNCNDAVIGSIPENTYTIHRMLKPLPGSPYFIHNSENPLPADVVVVDEASMVDLALMSKLLQAVPPSARLILLGDRDQLASVEAGSVLGDICVREQAHSFSKDFCRKIEQVTGEAFELLANRHRKKTGLYDAIVHLKRSYRFSADSKIGELSRTINLGNVVESMRLLKDSDGEGLEWEEVDSQQDLFTTLAKSIVKGYTAYLKTEDPETALEYFNRFKILCAVNFGPFGVVSVNRLAEQVLNQQGLINPDNQWYRGRPVLITRNDYNLGLYNGDIGITLRSPGSGNNGLYVFFSGTSGKLRRFSPHRLPEHETVYAMTVHKSQGSEFEHALFVLPARDYPVLTRELLYTGITRAKKSVSILGTEAVLSTSISKRIERTSGLRDALWGS
ncbi:exodeoxyribonuclease V subunit alpha [Thermodesulfobacteriota bacterium]